MRRCDLMNHQTKEQEAEIAAYIARECERIRATWADDDGQQRLGISNPIPVDIQTKP